MLLCNLNPKNSESIYGDVGLCGKLGYDDLQVSVKLRHHTTSIAFHPPGKVTYELNGQYEHFTSLIGFNDTSYPNIKADFLLYADDILVGAACGVNSNDQPREMFANLNGATKLELIIETKTPEGCHPVWINPCLHNEKLKLFPGVLGRALGRIPDEMPVCEKCIFTTLTPNFVDMLDDMLGSLYLNGECNDASLFIFTLNANDKCKRLAKKYNATLIPITVEHTNTLVLKSLVYSIAHFVNADYYLMLDADMFVLKSLKPIFDTIQATQNNHILVCRENGIPSDFTLRHLLTNDIHPYFSDVNDDLFLQIKEEGECNFIVNGGVIAGSRKAWLSLDNTMRTYMPHSSAWDAKKANVNWREQAIFNLALAKTQYYTELNPNFNIQLLYAQPDIQVQEKFILAFLNRQMVNVLHFNGVPGKEKYKLYASKFSHVSNPVFGANDIGAFNSFANLIQTYAKSIKNKPKLRIMYSDIDILNSQIYNYKFIYDMIAEADSPKILEIGSRAGLMSYCLASACHNNNGILQTVEMNTPEEYHDIISKLSNDIQNKIKHFDEDALVYLKKIQNLETFDIILCNTHNQDRNICSQILLAMNVLDKNGKLYIMDSKYPVCDIKDLERRLSVGKLKLQPLNDDKLKDLYQVLQIEDISE